MKRSLIILLIALGFSSHFQLNAQTKISQDPFAQTGVVQASKVHFLGKTEPLRDLMQQPGLSLEKRKKFKANKPKEIPNFMGRELKHTVKEGALPQGPDPLRQTNSNRSVQIPVEPLVNIEGMSSSNFGGTPPDPTGDIGEEFYIQSINGTWFRIFDKEGNPVTGAINMNTLWTPLGFSGLGDPIVLYDQEAKRWFITEFSTSGNNMLVAISETADPQGSYYAYNFTAPQFPDYPKYGIWNNAYVITTNEGAVPFYVLERAKMLAGEDDPGLQRFTIPSINGGPGFQVATPADWDGILPPPTGANPMILRINDDGWNQAPQDRIEVWSIDVDWENPNNSSISSENVLTAAFDSEGCAENGPGFACIPQPTGDGIDGIPWVIMNRVQYRNFGDYEVMVLNFMVDVSGTNDEVSGIRWMELRRTDGGDWSVYQEGTYAPDDGNHRFMGGIAMDGAGNIAMAYSISGKDKSPSLRFTGRRNGDSLGEMTIDEFEFGTGEGSINGVRYGDYASMSVDPTDDRTFWYTGEYKRPGQAWGTKIVAFQVGRDTTDIGPKAMLTPQTSDFLTADEVIVVDFENFGVDTQTVFEVGYILNDGTPFVETVMTVLPPDSIYNHVFAQNVNLSVIGDYNFKIFTNLPDDSNVLNDTLRVLVKQLSRYDAGITAINLDGEIACGETIPVELELTNFGTQTLTSANISYQLNTGTVENMVWTGSLEMGETEIINISVSGVQDGVNSLVVSTSEPSGQTDDVPTNDAFTRGFDGIEEGIVVDFWFRMDFNPGETSWKLRNSNDDVLYSGGPYPDAAPLVVITEQFCLHPDSCYEFKVVDLGGDGIGTVDGDYTLTTTDGVVLASLLNADFGFSETNFFCASGACLLEAEINITNETGADDGTIIINAQNGTGDLEYSIDGGNSFQGSNVFNDLEEGDYIVVVMDGNGCDYLEEVSVGLGVPTFEAGFDYKIEVFPNPTEGVFRVNMEGLAGVHYLSLQILDANGKIIQHSSMARYNEVLTGAFSLEAFPSGIYFIRFAEEGVNQLVRVVKQ
jgi:hypothetical protein